MDESAAAYVDPNVIDALTDVETRTEEHKVTRQQSIQRHPMRRAPLLVSSARHFQPNTLVHIGHEPAAIETLGIRAAKMVGSTNELCGCARNRSTAIVVALGRTRNGTAAGDH